MRSHAVAAEQQATLRQVRAAEADVRRQQRELAEASTKLAPLLQGRLGRVSVRWGQRVPAGT